MCYPLQPILLEISSRKTLSGCWLVSLPLPGDNSFCLTTCPQPIIFQLSFLTLYLLILSPAHPAAEHPPGGSLAGYVRETPGAARGWKQRELQGVRQRWALLHPWGPHHPTGHPGELHQDHQWTPDWHARQPAQGPGQLHPGNSSRGVKFPRCSAYKIPIFFNLFIFFTYKHEFFKEIFTFFPSTLNTSANTPHVNYNE